MCINRLLGKWPVVSTAGQWRCRTGGAAMNVPDMITWWTWSVRKIWLRDFQSVTTTGSASASISSPRGLSPPTSTGHSSRFSLYLAFVITRDLLRGNAFGRVCLWLCLCLCLPMKVTGHTVLHRYNVHERNCIRLNYIRIQSQTCYISASCGMNKILTKC